MRKILLVLFFLLLFDSCSVKYGFSGISIDYSKVKSMSINDFPNQAAIVYPPLGLEFNDYLKNYYTRNTKLFFEPAGGDLELEGEITRYDLSPLSVQESRDGIGMLSTMTRLTIAVKFRYRDNVTPTNDKNGEVVTVYRDFDSSKSLDEVQDALNKEMVEEIVQQMFNLTLTDWN